MTHDNEVYEQSEPLTVSLASLAFLVPPGVALAGCGVVAATKIVECTIRGTWTADGVIIASVARRSKST